MKKKKTGRVTGGLVKQGLTAFSQGKINKAELCLKQLRQARSLSAGGEYLSGLIAATKGDYPASEKSFVIAIQSQPQTIEYYKALAKVYAQQAKTQQAIEVLVAAIKVNSKEVEVRILFADQLQTSGELGGAHKVYEGLFAEGVRTREVITGLALCLRFAKANQYDPLIEQRLLEYLSIADFDYEFLSGYICSLLLHKYNLFDKDAQVDIEAFANDSLLIDALTKTTLTDSVLEKVLAQVRHYLFTQCIETNVVPKGWIRLIQALALQCFNNEYIYAITPEEIDLLKRTLSIIESDLDTDGWSWDNLGQLLLLVSLYQGLASLPKTDQLGKSQVDQIPDYLQEIHQLTYLDVMEELSLAATIESLTPIKDEVSRAVQSMYEDNPYPRWLKLHRQNLVGYDEYIKRSVQNIEPVDFFDGRPLNVLIAGCGTGRHALTVATGYRNINVTAIDISRRSLAYGMIKAKQYGIKNVRFLHADILRLDELKERFHIIESVGVLHHMADPEAGWSKLRQLLLPKGLMLIGLYSRRARQSIIQLRQTIAEQDLKAAPDDIRQFRSDLMENKITGDYSELNHVADFYSMSGCRDLLFHTHEHQFDLPQIQQACDQLALRFLGLSRGLGRIDQALRDYSQQYPDDLEKNNLANWDDFEMSHPSTFIGMYNFWCQAMS